MICIQTRYIFSSSHTGEFLGPGCHCNCIYGASNGGVAPIRGVNVKHMPKWSRGLQLRRREALGAFGIKNIARVRYPLPLGIDVLEGKGHRYDNAGK